MAEWVRRAEAVALTPGDIHVWRISLTAGMTSLAHAGRVLSPDEWARADRFRQERDRRRFVLARAAVRAILAAYLHAPAESLRFSYGPHGKPSLAAPETPVSFNVSHSEDKALVAVREGGPVGVDVERVRADFAGEDVAERFFCPAERAWLQAHDLTARAGAFFRLWTRKEAYIKGCGEGVWRDLAGCDVSHSPPAPVRVLPPSGAPSSAPWFLADLEMGPEYRAALAAEGGIGRVRTWHYMPDHEG